MNMAPFKMNTDFYALESQISVERSGGLSDPIVMKNTIP